MPANAPRRVFRNNSALAAWIFAACWLGMLLLFTGLAVRDGGVPGTGRWGWVVLGFFWLGGFGLVVWIAQQALLRITLSMHGIEVTERYPLRCDSRRYRRRELRAPRLESRQDSDGDPLHVCLLDLPGRAPVIVAQGPDLVAVDAVRQQLDGSLNLVCRLNDPH
jgi:hypothetical protein